MGQKITDLQTHTSPNSGDYIVIVDVSDDTQATTGSTKKMLYDTLSAALNPRGGSNLAGGDENQSAFTFVAVTGNDTTQPTITATNVTDTLTISAISGINVTTLTDTKTIVLEVTGGGSSYSNTDVDTHLNTSSGTNGQVLSLASGDYAWVDQSTGGGSSTSSDSGTRYTNVTGVSSSNGNVWSLDLSQNNKRYNLVVANGLENATNLGLFGINFQNIPQTGVTELRINISRDLYDQYHTGNGRFNHWTIYEDGSQAGNDVKRSYSNIPVFAPNNSTQTRWTIHTVDLFMQKTFVYGHWIYNTSFPSQYTTVATDANGNKWYVPDYDYVFDSYDSSYIDVADSTSITHVSVYNPTYIYTDGNTPAGVTVYSFGGVFTAAGGGNDAAISTTGDYMYDVVTDSNGFVTRFAIRVPRLNIYGEGHGNQGSSDVTNNLSLYGPNEY